MFDDPYETITPQSLQFVGSRLILRATFAIVNFTIAVLFAISCILAMVAPESPFQIIGAVVFAIPLAYYAYCEWCVLYHRNTSTERKLGIANLACAAFTVFAVVSNLVEALSVDEPPDNQFFFWCMLIGAMITLYLVASGCFRLKWTHAMLFKDQNDN